MLKNLLRPSSFSRFCSSLGSKSSSIIASSASSSSSIYFNSIAQSARLFHSSITTCAGGAAEESILGTKPTLMKEGFKLSELERKPRISHRERKRRRLVAIEKAKRATTGAPSLQDEIYNKRPVVEFPNRYFALYLPSVVNKTSKVVFHVPMDYTKPEIKEYLETYYGLSIKSVATIITQGRLKRSRKVRGKFDKEPDIKKAIVTLNEPVDLGFSDELKIELSRHYDKRLNAKIKEARAAAEKMKDEGADMPEGSEEEQMKQLEEAHRQMEEAKARVKQNKPESESVEVKDK
ncbi:hypothetical protein FDP41_006443 [Naegleria fowleri]|uniref:Large ribosomal subunit protein uL23m n=1 Tax=Naegleria fowleri TaxID=5763 RepID=A0A6A5BJ09_NAEFO|nr:uncharacterized protein FDP41_006443 [Naegleria fowleri]KAF0974411.1 hypothetical protein FDP41_006443 [Naegleria fowleri]CAG4714158.1 unnamed protein product [Naegleria fowleri]